MRTTRKGIQGIFLPDTTSFKFSLHKYSPARHRISSAVMVFMARKVSSKKVDGRPDVCRNIHASASVKADS